MPYYHPVWILIILTGPSLWLFSQKVNRIGGSAPRPSQNGKRVVREAPEGPSTRATAAPKAANEDKVRTLREEVAALKKEAAKLKRWNQEVENSKNQIARDLAKKESDLVAANSVIEEIRRELKESQTVVNTTFQRLGAKDVEMQSLQERNRRLEIERQQLYEDNCNMQAEIRTMQAAAAARPAPQRSSQVRPVANQAGVF